VRTAAARAAVLAALVFAFVTLPVVAQDGDRKKENRPISGDEAAKMAIGRFEEDFKSKDEGKRMNAIHSLSQTRNDLVTEKLGTLLRHPLPDVRMAAAMAIDGQYNNEKLAGEILRKHIASRKEDDQEVLITACLSLGRLNHADAIPEMGELLEKSEFIFVKIEVLKAFRKMKDTRALLPILELWLKNPQGYSWEGGEVSYDSGAPGTHDQEKAEQMYKEKYGHGGRKGAPPTMLKTFVQAIVEAVEAICGEKLENPTELMQWMVKHEADLPYKLPGKVKSTLKEWEERARKKAEKDEKGKK